MFGFERSKKAVQEINIQRKSNGFFGVLSWLRGSQLTSEDLANESYCQNAVFFACVRRVVNQLNTIPIILKKGKDDVEQNPLLDLINHPNRNEGKDEFFKIIAANILIFGNAYVVKRFNFYTPTPHPFKIAPQSLKTTLTGNVTTYTNEYDEPSKYEIQFGRKRLSYQVVDDMSDVIHFMDFNPISDDFGIGCARPAELSIAHQNKANLWNNNLLNNDARKPGILRIKDGVTEEQAEDIRNKLQRFYAGYNNAHKIPVIDEEFVEYQDMSYSPVDMEFLEGVREAGKMICAALGVPPDLIFGQATYENLQTSNEQMAENTTIPLMNHIISELNRSLVPHFGDDIRLVANVEQMPAMIEKRSRLRQSLEGVTYLTINEKRQMTGFEPIPGADTLFVDFGRVPIDSVTGDPLSEDQYAKQLQRQGYSRKEALELARVVYGDHK